MSGQLPLWSPDLFMGVPLLGNSQLGTFYPPNWLVAPLSPPDGVRVSILLHVCWAALGTYALARRALGVSRMAALIAAVVFAFGGHIGAHVEQINQLQGLAWLPWLLYIFDRALKRPLPNALLLGMGLAFQFFTGHTQTVFITGVALAIYALGIRPRRGILTLAGAGIVAGVLAVPQLIPTLELTRLSNRSGGLTLNGVTAFSFSPFVTGRGLLPSYDTLIFGEYVASPGIIGLGLALVGAFAGASLKRTVSVFKASFRWLPTLKARFSPLSTQWMAKLRFAREADPHLVSRGEVISPRAIWLIIALVGLALAYGIYNPLYWLLASLPGFNLFRVPARWLALFALGTAMLAALGVEWLANLSRRGFKPSATEFTRPLKGQPSPATDTKQPLQWVARFFVADGLNHQRHIPIIIVLILALAASSALTLRQNDLTPISLPTPLTLAGWALALVVLIVGLWRRTPRILALAIIVELALASLIMPYNQLVPPDSYSSQRLTTSQLLAYTDQSDNEPWWKTAVGRTLSISQLLFDPGDRDALSAQYAALGMSPEAIALAFDTVKMRETLAANQPLVWGIPSVDGYDGGLLPTTYYSAFTSLFLPNNEPTSDGRLRELLARPACNGACIPDQRWLDLMDVRYLITDKNYDLVYDGIFYDTTLKRPYQEGDDLLPVNNPSQFYGDRVDLLYECLPDYYDLCRTPEVSLNAVRGINESLEPVEQIEIGGLTLLRSVRNDQFPQSLSQAPVSIFVQMLPETIVRAVTLVDTRTGDFQQLSPAPWTRVLSSDIKLYENAAVLPRAFVVPEAQFVTDDDAGTEAALALMRDPAFDPSQTVILADEGAEVSTNDTNGHATITTYTDSYIAIEVDSDAPGYLVLTDAYYPDWTATLNLESVSIERADVMFRAVHIPAGRSYVAFLYQPSWLAAPLVGGIAWLITLVAAIALIGSKYGALTARPPESAR